MTTDAKRFRSRLERIESAMPRADGTYEQWREWFTWHPLSSRERPPRPGVPVGAPDYHDWCRARGSNPALPWSLVFYMAAVMPRRKSGRPQPLSSAADFNQERAA